MPDVRELSSLIDGEPVDAGDEPVELTDPAHLDTVVSRVRFGDAGTFALAAERADAAQAAWAAVPAPVRGVAIHDLGRIIAANKEALARIITREVGKPYAESLGEVQEAIDTCIFFASEGRRLYGMTVPSEMPDKQLFTYRTPVGTMAIITAGNFPMAVPSWYIVPALVAGNAIVWKPAEYAPAIAEAFHRCMRAAGIPDGVVQLVLTDGPQTSEGLERALIAGHLDKVGFTGSSEVGRSIATLCGEHLVAPTLELGGKNPLVVMPDADLDLAVEGALFSGFGTAGQRCTSLGIVAVHESIHGDFLDRFAKAVGQAAVGDPMMGVLYGPMISAKFARGFEGWLDHIQPHHTVLGSSATGPASSPGSGPCCDMAAGWWTAPSWPRHTAPSAVPAPSKWPASQPPSRPRPNCAARHSSRGRPS